MSDDNNKQIMQEANDMHAEMSKPVPTIPPISLGDAAIEAQKDQVNGSTINNGGSSNHQSNKGSLVGCGGKSSGSGVGFAPANLNSRSQSRFIFNNCTVTIITGK